jgi:hypothetical protein
MKINNQSGMLMIDFLFSLVLAILLTSMLLAISFTFTMAEISQYIAFSGARAHAAADVTIKDQKERGLAKVDELIKKNGVFRPLLDSSRQSSWFSLKLKDIRSGGNSSTGGDPSDNYDAEYPQMAFLPTGGIPQIGLRLDFEAKVLNLNLGTLGATNDNEGLGYKAVVTGLLFREPTQAECQDLMSDKKRYQNILNLDQRFKNIISINNVQNGKFFPMEDNGC